MNMPSDQEQTSEEHVRAQMQAHLISLKRGDGTNSPPYDPALADVDFWQAAGKIIGQRRPSQPGNAIPNLHEEDPRDPDRGRDVPIALRRYPALYQSGKALDEFMKMQDDLSNDDYWSLLGHIWVFAPKDRYNFNARYSRDYAVLFSSTRPGREQLMTPQERADLSSFASPLAVNRGCRANINENGLSWTRSVRKAVDFAHTWNSDNEVLIKGTCNVADVIAYFNYDNERELIILNAADKVTNRERVTLHVPVRLQDWPD